MKRIFELLWRRALPFQDKRNDKGHAKTVVGYAQELCGLEFADEEVVIPAAILHDIGWSQLSPEKRLLPFSNNATADAILTVRIHHQEESVKMARKFLQEVGYPPKLIPEILEIISQHDTRQGFISKNEGVMRDADKLWRYSKIGFWADLKRKKISFEELHETYRQWIDEKGFFYSVTAQIIARNALEFRRKEYTEKTDKIQRRKP